MHYINYEAVSLVALTLAEGSMRSDNRTLHGPIRNCATVYTYASIVHKLSSFHCLRYISYMTQFLFLADWLSSQ
jgi:hypothetical protein